MQRDDGDLRRVRAVLWRWGKADKRVDELTEQMNLAIKRFDEIDRDIGGHAPPDGQPRSTVPGDPVFRQYEAREKLRGVYTEEIETCAALIAEEKRFQAGMNELVAALSQVERDVLRERYVNGAANWEYVGYKLHMDEATARRFEREACKKLAGRMVF